jgi:hypothetical protein
MTVPASVRTRNIFRSSYNTALGVTPATIWPKNTAYVFPTVAAIMTLYSTSVLDTTQQVLIDGLDANYSEISEVLTLNGQTGVNTVNQYLRINNLVVLTDSPQGDIALGTGTALLGVPANTYGFIAAGDNIQQSAVYTVPKGWSLFLTQGSLSMGAATGSHVVTANVYSRVNGVKYLNSKVVAANSFQPFPYNPEVEIAEKTDIWNNASTDSGSAAIAATFNGQLRRDTIGSVA